MTTTETSPESQPRAKWVWIVAGMFALLLGIVLIQGMLDPPQPNRVKGKHDAPVLELVGPQR